MLETEARSSDDAAVGGSKSKLTMKRGLDGWCILGSEHLRTIYVQLEPY